MSTVRGLRRLTVPAAVALVLVTVLALLARIVAVVAALVADVAERLADAGDQARRTVTTPVPASYSS
ncbi:hypothetical protein ACIRG5_42440 [Lentzea sp. NPDC102401]|uniref:hypothetical protein n=1 Tax=Lentzea sp. NPDC102401 TaxID=3364128 RepID=UPI0038234D67